MIIASVCILALMVLWAASVDAQLQRIERKVNSLLDDMWDLLDARKDKDEGRG